MARLGQGTTIECRAELKLGWQKVVNATHNRMIASRRQPIVTGTSVLGLKFNGGVLLAADNLGKLSPPAHPPRLGLSV